MNFNKIFNELNNKLIDIKCWEQMLNDEWNGEEQRRFETIGLE